MPWMRLRKGGQHSRDKFCFNHGGGGWSWPVTRFTPPQSRLWDPLPATLKVGARTRGTGTYLFRAKAGEGDDWKGC